MDIFSMLFALSPFILFVLYFSPCIIASAKRHKNRTQIYIVTLFLGWTLIGWVACLAWAVGENKGE
jgi:hypothetical protein